MESQHMLVTADQNTPAKGYGNPDAAGFREDPRLTIWARFYGLDYLPSYDEAVTVFEAESKGGDAKRGEMAAGPTYAKMSVWTPGGTIQLLNIQVYKVSQ